MRVSDLLRDLEEKVPLDIALEGDLVGYIGPGSPDSFDVGRVLVVMDYLPGVEGACRAYDLLVLHHPPPVSPGVPAYVMHSNWDIVDGGAADALARCLGITVDSVLDQETGLGRVGRLQDGPSPWKHLQTGSSRNWRRTISDRELPERASGQEDRSHRVRPEPASPNWRKRAGWTSTSRGFNPRVRSLRLRPGAGGSTHHATEVLFSSGLN